LEPGPVVTVEGEVVGEHSGYAGFTVGQRKGLGGGFDEPMYVVAVRPEDRAVVIGPRRALGSRSIRVGELNWLADPPDPGTPVDVQVRYRAPAVRATVTGRGARRLRLELDALVRAVTPGQSAVIFRGERVLGGGRIERPPVGEPLSRAPEPRPAARSAPRPSAR
ncbi:MAG: hypothetical protein PVI57_12900, partial [Gemmatimonadota bacterium]